MHQFWFIGQHRNSFQIEILIAALMGWSTNWLVLKISNQALQDHCFLKRVLLKFAVFVILLLILEVWLGATVYVTDDRRSSIIVSSLNFTCKAYNGKDVYFRKSITLLKHCDNEAVFTYHFTKPYCSDISCFFSFSVQVCNDWDKKRFEMINNLNNTKPSRGHAATASFSFSSPSTASIKASSSYSTIVKEVKY